MPIAPPMYEYTATDRLATPHDYMYSEYAGTTFLQSYFGDRSNFLKRFSNLEHKKGVNKIDEFFCASAICILDNSEMPVFDISMGQIEPVRSLKWETEVDTSKLLEFLIHKLLSKRIDPNVKEWLDFLVQRFEVTKKLFEGYHLKKLRVGKGDSKIVRLYWLFSVLLVLFYSQVNNLKYLSTLLKVNDLISSLDNMYLEFIPSEGINLIITTEVGFIKNLSGSAERSNFDFK